MINLTKEQYERLQKILFDYAMTVNIKPDPEFEKLRAEGHYFYTWVDKNDNK